MSYKIHSYSGFFYVIDKNTGKLIIEQSFRTYDDAKRAAKNWIEYLAK
jgi:glucose dehydrogenase